MSAKMSDNLNVPFTIVKQGFDSGENKEYHWKQSYQHDRLVIDVENIRMIQDPSETLNMRVEISTNVGVNNSYDSREITIRNNNGKYVRLKHHHYSIELRFFNYLHEFNKNYRYEIICKMTDMSGQKDECLFSCTEVRLTDCVKYGQQYVSLVDRDLTSWSQYGVLYFCIRRRFNESNDMMDNERVHRVLSTLRNSGCDVILEAKDGDIRAHKSILSQNSEVFQAMFSLEMKEKQSGIIDLSDFEKKVVEKMLDYLYTGELGELGDMTESLFKLAHRYQLLDLCRRCEEYYIFNVKVDNDNIVEILELTEMYDLEKLNECAVNFAKLHEPDLTMIPRYREYLIQSINVDNAVTMLLLAEKYGLKDVKMKTFDFIKDNYLEMMEIGDFLKLFESKGGLMKEFYVYKK